MRNMLIIACLTIFSSLHATTLHLLEHQQIPLGETLSIQVPAGSMPRYLAFAGRIYTERFSSGSQPALEIRVNDIPINELRLVNKGDYFHFKDEHRVPWFSNNRTITLTYYPWSKAQDTLDKDFVHDFVFDLEGLFSQAGNTINFINKFKAFPNSSIEIKNVRLASGDFPLSPTLSEKKPRSLGLTDLRWQASMPHKGVNAVLDCSDDFEQVAVHIDFAPSNFKSTLPDIDLLPNNAIAFKAGTAENLIESYWKAEGKDAQPTGKSTWSTPDFSVSREIIKGSRSYTVKDTMRNLTERDLPVIFGNSIKVDLSKLREFRTGGEKQKNFTCNSDNLAHRELAFTPLYFFRYADSAFAVYIEDACYRNQYSAIAVDDKLHLANDLFYLEPGKSYTTAWKLYFTPDANYFSILNILRQDYDLYQEIPGLFGFVYPFKNSDDYDHYYRQRLNSPELLRTFFEQSGITIPCALPIAKDDAQQHDGIFYGNEESQVYAKALETPTRLLQNMRAAGIELPLLMYTDVHLVRTRNDFDFGAQSKWQERLSDSVIKNYFGGTVPYRAGQLYHVAPRPDNASGKQIKTNMSYILDKAGFSGIFLDEWNHSSARVAYNLNDGYSALLDKNGKIRQKIAFIPLYSKDFLLEIGKQLTEKEKMGVKNIVYANQFDCLTELMPLPISHFVEPVAHEYCYLVRAAQASRSPLTLTCKRNTTAWSDVKYFLRHGLVVCFYASRMYGEHPLKKLYPITITEIYPGIVVGKNKIFTNRSGIFTLNNQKRLTAYIYSDPEGQLSRHIVGETSIELELNPNTEVALILSE
ncbi:MAG: hypothetical protein GX574_00070 [Lentisphaerae bacterium]|nr:hypothetical protein [Lentisphaerota bacterium]